MNLQNLTKAELIAKLEAANAEVEDLQKWRVAFVKLLKGIRNAGYQLRMEKAFEGVVDLPKPYEVVFKAKHIPDICETRSAKRMIAWLASHGCIATPHFFWDGKGSFIQVCTGRMVADALQSNTNELKAELARKALATGSAKWAS